MAVSPSNRPRVLFLDDDADLREIVADLITAFGASCRAVGTVAELRGVIPGDFDLAILDVNLGPGAPDGVDASDCLRESGFRGRIAFLTGHARTHPLVERAASLGDAVVLEKPITSAQLLELLSP